MRQTVSLMSILVVLAMGFLFILLTEMTIILGILVFPLSLYYLVQLKLKSEYHYWLTCISYIVPIFFFFTPISWIAFVVLYVVAAIITHTLKARYTQEVTYFYVAASIALITLGALIILQLFNVIPRVGEMWASFNQWYFTQLEVPGMNTFDFVDPDTIRVGFDQFYLNLPGHFTVFSLFTAIYVVLVLRVMLRNKKSIELWQYRKFQDWIFPRFVMYLFFVLFLTSFFMTEGTTFYAVVSNSLLVVEWILYIHGLAFIYFLLRRKNINIGIALLLLIPLVILRPITMLIGLFEMAFRIRLLILMRRK